MLFGWNVLFRDDNTNQVLYVFLYKWFSYGCETYIKN